jgi:hypothetical protein
MLRTVPHNSNLRYSPGEEFVRHSKIPVLPSGTCSTFGVHLPSDHQDNEGFVT